MIEFVRSGEVLILLVEDIAENQLLAEIILEDIGLPFDLSENGQEAIDAIKNCKYDIVLMDIQMPVMDGLTATKEIRKTHNPADLPFLALYSKKSTGSSINGLSDLLYSSTLLF